MWDSFVKKTKIPFLLMMCAAYMPCLMAWADLPFGALASKLAVQFFKSSIRLPSDYVSEDELRSLAHSIHKNIVDCGQVVGGENGIGCTFSGLSAC